MHSPAIPWHLAARGSRRVRGGPEPIAGSWIACAETFCATILRRPGFLFRSATGARSAGRGIGFAARAHHPAVGWLLRPALRVRRRRVASLVRRKLSRRSDPCRGGMMIITQPQHGEQRAGAGRTATGGRRRAGARERARRPRGPRWSELPSLRGPCKSRARKLIRSATARGDRARGSLCILQLAFLSSCVESFWPCSRGRALLLVVCYRRASPTVPK